MKYNISIESLFPPFPAMQEVEAKYGLKLLSNPRISKSLKNQDNSFFITQNDSIAWRIIKDLLIIEDVDSVKIW